MLKWLVADNDQVKRNQIIGRYLLDGKEHDLICQNDGRIKICAGDPVAIIECLHSVQVGGLCALCGADLTAHEKAATIAMTHDAKGVFVTIEEAQRKELERANYLIKHRKLSLLLDLDQTVIHASVDMTIGEWLNDPENPNFPKLTDVYSFVLPESHLVYYIKLRPHTRDFLKAISGIYELHIYTMGTRPYAHAVAKVLDPTGELFNDRILSRDESGSFTLKSIQRLFPCDQSMVVVVDDRADVWQWSPNLLKVRPYIFFQGIGDINEPIPLTEPNSKENVNDLVTQNKHTKLAKVSNHEQEKVNRPMLLDFDYDLKYLQQTVVSIHEKFYGLRDKNAPADSREIITSLKQRVLRGTTILFSAVIPLGVEPETHDLWRFAVSFGATCTSELSNHVTHVIAINPGTIKVVQAKSIAHIWIVTPEWLMDSVAKWQRADEEHFCLEPHYRPSLDLRKEQQADVDIANDDAELVAKFGADDWKEMDQEILDELGSALNSSDSDSGWGEVDSLIDNALNDSDGTPEVHKRKRSGSHSSD